MIHTKITAKNGKARPKNPFDKDPLSDTGRWHAFESTVQWHDCPECEDGEYTAYQVMQEHLLFYKEYEWTDCVVDGNDPIVQVSKGAQTRIIWRIVSQPQEKQSEIGNYEIESATLRGEVNPTHVTMAVPQNKEAKTVEGKTELKRVAMIEAKSYFTGWDDLNIGIDTYYWAFQKGAEYASQQNKALIEDNSKLRQALQTISEADFRFWSVTTCIDTAKQALKPTP